MKKAWQLQEAKNRFSEVVEAAKRQGPQLVTRRGKETAMVLSIEEFRKLTKPKKSLIQFFKDAPINENSLDLSRSDDPGREIDL